MKNVSYFFLERKSNEQSKIHSSFFILHSSFKTACLLLCEVLFERVGVGIELQRDWHCISAKVLGRQVVLKVVQALHHIVCESISCFLLPVRESFGISEVRFELH